MTERLYEIEKAVRDELFKTYNLPLGMGFCIATTDTDCTTYALGFIINENMTFAKGIDMLKRGMLHTPLANITNINYILKIRDIEFSKDRDRVKAILRMKIDYQQGFVQLKELNNKP